MWRQLPVLVAGVVLAASAALAQDVRARTRLGRPGATTISESQAAALTLTVSTASRRPVQTWVRMAGTIDRTRKVLTGSLSGPEAALVTVGQRVRAFPPSSRSSMFQARVTRVTPRRDGATIEVSLTSASRQDDEHYIMEIVVERGPFLSVPNEALIEEGARQIVYVQRQPGQYVPEEVQTGIQGELYTEILSGLAEGAEVVTFGSFFIDAEQKLKGTARDLQGSDR